MRATQAHHQELQPVFRFLLSILSRYFALLSEQKPRTTTTTIQKRKKEKREALNECFTLPHSFYFILFFSFRFVLGWLNCRATRIGTEENEKYTTVLLANIFIHQSQKEHGEEKR